MNREEMNAALDKGVELQKTFFSRDFIALWVYMKKEIYYRFGRYCHKPRWDKDLEPHRFFMLKLSYSDEFFGWPFLKWFVCVIPYIFAQAIYGWTIFTESLFLLPQLYFFILCISVIAFFWNVEPQEESMLDNYLQFDRHSGNLIVVRKNRDTKNYAFSDLTAIVQQDRGRLLLRCYILWLKDEKTGDIFKAEKTYFRWEILLLWNLLQDFMDPTMPLPDMPRFEPFRREDPATVAFDKANNRDPYYFRNMSQREFKLLQKEAFERCRKLCNKEWVKRLFLIP